MIAPHSYYNSDTQMPLEVAILASITVRNLDEELKRRLRIRAAENGKSMEQEARDILRAALVEAPSTGSNPASAIRAPWRCRIRALAPQAGTRTAPIRLRRRYSLSLTQQHFWQQDCWHFGVLRTSIKAVTRLPGWYENRSSRQSQFVAPAKACPVP